MLNSFTHCFQYFLFYSFLNILFSKADVLFSFWCGIVIYADYGIGEKPSQAGDVYGFGVMLLELSSGKSPMDEFFEEDQNLISWISYGFQGNAIMEVIDPKLKRLIDVSGAQLHAKLDCLKKTIEVGLACTAYAAGERMNMRDVLRLLKEAKGKLIKGN